jgi:hypothetical protein
LFLSLPLEEPLLPHHIIHEDHHPSIWDPHPEDPLTMGPIIHETDREKIRYLIHSIAHYDPLGPLVIAMG